MKEELKIIHDYVANDIDEWSKRRKQVLTPPYPADYPCYYCSLLEYIKGVHACDYCIHNPNAKIFAPIPNG